MILPFCVCVETGGCIDVETGWGTVVITAGAPGCEMTFGVITVELLTTRIETT